jgi:hypothetical protein
MQGRMAWGIHGHPKESLDPAMPNPSTPYGRPPHPWGGRMQGWVKLGCVGLATPYRPPLLSWQIQSSGNQDEGKLEK